MFNVILTPNPKLYVIEQKQHAKMQNPRDQDYCDNEMLAFLKIYRTPREGCENFHELWPSCLNNIES